MRARGAELPVAARATVACAALAAALCTAPALERHRETEWTAVLPLAALYALCEYAPRCPLMRRRMPNGPGALRPVFFPVLLAAVCLLPPSAAALTAVPGALVGRVDPRHAPARRVWHAARLTLALCAASHVSELLGVDAGQARFPYALLPAMTAALTLCAVLTALDGWILVTAERCSPRTAWRGQLARSAGPHVVHGLAGLMMAVLWRSAYGPVAAMFVLLPMCICSWVFAQYQRERGAHQATIRALVQAVDIKDRYTRGHSERVGRASVLIARELGMGEERTETLRFAGILHDVGKLGVPTRLLRKDGPLTPQERRVIELHPEYGHEMVRGIGFLGEARSAILHHHERMDGSGYPYGLSGTDIPEFARVVAVADAFDAMTSTRSYRRARPVPVALEELRRCAGTQFDPRMVAALIGALERQDWSVAVTADLPGEPVPANAPQETPGAPPEGPDTGAESGDPAGRRASGNVPAV
ncbi:HD-GYP domain-containing protein [Streptomyces iconiensis]|uniref:HD-GYP domain-containing protein n=1 Tax=Streptomyces iconiensis TaxID=1384038 RepID=A0ABT7A4M4_9ACTN|nr:HD-GYP domain-containing protein [Streptomyces iconiensis]MDJ1135568.1 HD-GYP domain-containing protein [Streptomyces iconiensis]